jgi:hypothetical protein
MVGEGVMLECLRNPQVDSVPAACRKPLDFSHPKLKTFVVPAFLKIDTHADQTGTTRVSTARGLVLME